MKSFIVCNCNMVMSDEIKNIVDKYPEMKIEDIQKELKIGTRCGACLIEDSPTVDMTSSEFFKCLKI